MPSRTRLLIGTSVLLSVLTIGTLALALQGYETYVTFQNPYSYVPTDPASSIEGMGMQPIANYTVVFVLDGLRADTFFSTPKPNILSYGDWANFSNVQCSTLTSVSTTGYGVIFSGANSTESQVISNEYEGEYTADTIWNATIRNSGTTAFVGGRGWHELFGRWLNYSIYFRDNTMFNITNSGTPHEVPGYERNDTTVAQFAEAVVRQQRPSLLGVHFSETDSAGEDNGPFDESYIDAFKTQDELIGSILAAYDDEGILNQTVVIITADHGMVSVGPSKGNHGGIEPEALHIPLLIRGPGVIPDEYSQPIHQNSITPTISALMGFEIPSDCSGRVLFEALDLTDDQEAIYRINLAQIRLSQAAIRAERMGLETDFEAEIADATTALDSANAAFQESDYSDAINTAIQSELISRNILRKAFESKIIQEVINRTIVASGIIAFLVIVGILYSRQRPEHIKQWKLRQRKTVLPFIGILIYFIVLFIAIPLTGWKFSASFVPEAAEDFMIPVLTTTLLTYIVSGFAFLMIMRYAGIKQDISERGYLASAVLYLVGIAIAYSFAITYFIVRNGPGLPWYAPDLVEGIQYFFTCISGMAFGLFSLISLSLVVATTKMRRIQPTVHEQP